MGSYDDVINEDLDDFIRRMADHFKHHPDDQFTEFHDGASMYDLSDPTSLPWKLLKSIFNQLREKKFYNCWERGEGVFPEKDEVLEKDWDYLNSLVVTIVDETLTATTQEQIPPDQRLNIISWFGQNQMSNVPPNRAVAPKEVHVVQPVVLAVRALASTISARYDPMFREMARQPPDLPIRPFPCGRGASRGEEGWGERARG